MIESIDIIIRRRIIFIIIISLVGIISFKLFRLQILERSRFEQKSKNNSIKKEIIDAPRGVLLDRNGEILVSNKPSYDVLVTPFEYNTELNGLLEKSLELDSGYVDAVLHKYRMYSKYAPRLIKRDAPFEVISWYEENSVKLPGVSYKVGLQRDYNFGVNGAHYFGYLNEISGEMLKKNRDIYSLGDFVGVSGLEKVYENYLRGEKGYKLIVVDSRGKKVRDYESGKKDKAPHKGNDLLLTIDKKTQKVAEQLFKDKRGGVVAMDPQTGEIIAFVSAPQYDLNNFGKVKSGEYIKQLNEDPGKPLFNRVTLAQQSPGSTFKMLVALAMLQEGVIGKNDYVVCKGGLEIGGRLFKCTHVHGKVNVEEAIEKSCNTFFYNYIFRLGLNNYEKYSRLFGFGKPTGIDLPFEEDGLVPSKKYYDRVYGKRNWNKGQLISLSIGQGELSVTLMQLVQYTSLLANKGWTIRPHLVKAIKNSEINSTEPLSYDTIRVDGIRNKNWDLIRKGMYKVVNGDGTATNIKMQEIEIAGKTGTVQNPHGEDHALFVAFAPFDHPRIAIAVLVENVGYGSTYAAPIAQELIKSYLLNNNKSVRDGLAAK